MESTSNGRFTLVVTDYVVVPYKLWYFFMIIYYYVSK